MILPPFFRGDDYVDVDEEDEEEDDDQSASPNEVGSRSLSGLLEAQLSGTCVEIVHTHRCAGSSAPSAGTSWCARDLRRGRGVSRASHTRRADARDPHLS